MMSDTNSADFLELHNFSVSKRDSQEYFFFFLVNRNIMIPNVNVAKDICFLLWEATVIKYYRFNMTVKNNHFP